MKVLWYFLKCSVLCFGLQYSAYADCFYGLDASTRQNYSTIIRDMKQDFELASIKAVFQSLGKAFARCSDEELPELSKKYPEFSDKNLEIFFNKYYQSMLKSINIPSIDLDTQKKLAYSKLMLGWMHNYVPEKIKNDYDNTNDNTKNFWNNFIVSAEKVFRDQAGLDERYTLKILLCNILNAHNPELRKGLLDLLTISEPVYKDDFDLLNQYLNDIFKMSSSVFTKTRHQIMKHRQAEAMDGSGEIEPVSVQTVLEELLIKKITNATWETGSKSAFLKEVNEKFREKEVLNKSKQKTGHEAEDQSSPWKKNNALYKKILDALPVNNKAKKHYAYEDRQRRRGSGGYGGGHGGAYAGGRGGSHGAGSGGSRGFYDIAKTGGLLGYAVKSDFAESRQEFEQKEQKRPETPKATATFLKSSGLHTNRLFLRRSINGSRATNHEYEISL